MAHISTATRGRPQLIDTPIQYILFHMIGKVIWLLMCLINVHQRRDKLNICWRNDYFQQLAGKAVSFAAWWFYVWSASPINTGSHKGLLQKSTKVAIFFTHYWPSPVEKCQTRTAFIFRFCSSVPFPVTVFKNETAFTVREDPCRLRFRSDSTASTCSFVCGEEVNYKKKLCWLDYSFPIASWGVLLFESQQSANGNRCIHQRLLRSITSSNNEVLQSIISQ